MCIRRMMPWFINLSKTFHGLCRLICLYWTIAINLEYVVCVKACIGLPTLLCEGTNRGIRVATYFLVARWFELWIWAGMCTDIESWTFKTFWNCIYVSSECKESLQVVVSVPISTVIYLDQLTLTTVVDIGGWGQGCRGCRGVRLVTVLVDCPLLLHMFMYQPTREACWDLGIPNLSNFAYLGKLENNSDVAAPSSGPTINKEDMNNCN